MSEATKRKHVIKEILHDEFTPPTAQQKIVKVLNSKGNNLHEVEEADSTTYLVTMPTKFRKNVWVKRGDFLLVEPIEEGNKVCLNHCTLIINISLNHFLYYFR